MRWKYIDFQKTGGSYGWGLGLRSKDEDSDYNLLMIKLHKYWLGIKLPNIVKPKLTVVNYTMKGEEKSYTKLIPREYSISLYDNHVNIYYGLDAGDSLIDNRYGFFLPWNEWKLIRHSCYDKDGKFHSSVRYDCFSTDICSKRRFEFLDFDGEKIIAETMIEEREWSRGVGYFSWLKYFYKNKIRRSLSIDFSSEVGKGKGSYKGGIVGHGIDMNKGETHKEAFIRYCKEYNLTFLGEV